MSVGSTLSILPGVQGTATYGTDRHSGPDIKLGPKKLDNMSKAQLLQIAQDKEGKYDVNTQIEAAKRLSNPTLKMTLTNSDLRGLSPAVLGYLSVTGTASLKKQITAPPQFIMGQDVNPDYIMFYTGVEMAEQTTTRKLQ